MSVFNAIPAPIEAYCVLSDSAGVISSPSAFGETGLMASNGSSAGSITVQTGATFPSNVTVTLSCAYAGGSGSVSAGGITLSAVQSSLSVQ